MRVAFVVGEFPSVSETFILQQIASLLHAGVDVEVFPLEPLRPAKVQHAEFGDIESRTYRKNGTPEGVVGRWAYLLRQYPTMNAVTRSTLGRTIFSGIQNPRRWAFGSLLDNLRLLERMPFDVVHAHFGHIGIRSACLPWNNRLPPLVTTFHGWDANVAPQKYGAGYYNTLFKYGSAFTVNSDFLRNRLISLGCPGEKITKIPMGVDVEKFAFVARRREPNEPVKLLTVGRLVPVKGHADAIRAVAQLQKEGMSIKYTILGGGKLLGELQSLAEELGIVDCVEFLGPQPFEVVREAYYRSHLFVLPSVRLERGDEETQGVVVQEAQATGMPVVVTDIGGVAEGMVPEMSGVVARSRNPESLAGAIRRLIEREADWRALGLAGREFVEKKYDSRFLSNQLIESYCGLAQKTLWPLSLESTSAEPQIRRNQHENLAGCRPDRDRRS